MSSISRLSIYLLLSFSLTAQAQDGSGYIRQKKGLESSIQRLDKSLVARSASNKRFAIRLNELRDINELLHNYLGKLDSLAAGKAPVSMRPYVQELHNYELLLDSAGKLAGPEKPAPILHFIDDDLLYKIDNVRSPGSQFKDRVPVKVRVFDGVHTTELPGYNVFVKPELSLDKSLIETFNPTPNAQKDITPGKKIFWLEKKGYKSTSRQEGIYYYMTADTVDFLIN